MKATATSSLSEQDLVDRWVRPEVKALSAYNVPDSTGFVKLDAMENPYGLPDGIKDKWLQALGQCELNRYPDAKSRGLVQQLRDVFGIDDHHAILLGNGSDELIQMIALALAGMGRTVLTPGPGFSMYRLISQVAGLEYVEVPLKSDDFDLDLPAMRKAIASHNPAVIFLSYPNNPTGNLFSKDKVLELIAMAPGLVVIDEAYAAFSEKSMLSHLGEYPNILLMRTLSKMGLAGLRLGLLVGSRHWLDEFDKIRLPYNINVLTQTSARFFLEHKPVFDKQARQIISERESLGSTLDQIDYLQPFPSQANFILARTRKGASGAIFDYLRENRILIKNLHRSGPLLQDCLRITIGTAEENALLLSQLSEYSVSGEGSYDGA